MAASDLTLTASVEVAIGAFTLDVGLDVSAGETIAVLGPNGAGKTTLLRALAGLQPIDRGRIALGPQVLDDPAAGVFVPAEKRSVAVVFQDYLLFPHLSVLDNVAFGPQARGASRTDARQRAAVELDRIGLADRALDRPSTLSGGQAQRVALARAIATDPDLLLLDEPLAALDAQTRAAVRRELRRRLAAFAGPRLIVTHDPLDAFTLAHRVVVIESGLVTQAGTPAEIAALPRSSYVAEVAGTNLYEATADGTSVTTPSGFVLTTGVKAFGEVFLVIPPRAVALYRQRPEGTPRNVWRAAVDHLDPGATTVRVHLAGDLPIVVEVTPAAVAALGLREGDTLWASVKATEIDVTPA